MKIAKEKKYMLWKVYSVYFGFVSILLFGFTKTISIQLEGAGNLLDFGSKSIKTRTVDREARFGDILDANFSPLVTSVTYFDIYMDPTIVSQSDFDEGISGLSKGLSKLFKKEPSYYQQKIANAREEKNKYLLIKRSVTNKQRKELSLLPIFELGKYKGGFIDNNQTSKRKRPNGELLKRTLGYYKNDNGKEYRVGIEGAFWSYLKGKPGKEIEQKISSGWKKTGEVIKESQDGANIITSIDKDIQEVAHSELEKQLKLQEARSGCVVVMDVNTGFVKAIVNLTRNPNGKYLESYNHAVGTKSVPGSTFKLASLMALLEDEKVKINDVVNANGKYTFYDRSLHDSKPGGYGEITIKRAFEKSSNVFSKIVNDAYKDNPDLFIRRLESFGLTKKLGVSIAGEAVPKFNTPGNKGWSGISLPWMAIGYEFEQTPLQTLVFYNAVANKGKMLRPQFVKQIVQNGKAVKEFSSDVLISKVCSESTIETLKNCMIGVMKKGGTGEKLTSTQFEIAGKTGTAKLLNETNQYDGRNKGKYQASFVGFFPANKPIYSCIVVVSDPKVEIYGAKVSGTVFNAIANKVYATRLEYHEAINESNVRSASLPKVDLSYKKDLIYLMSRLGVKHQKNNKDIWVKPVVENNQIALNEMRLKKGLLPDFNGMTAKDAVFLIESLGLVPQIKGFGRVYSQSITVDAPIVKGALIQIKLK